MSLLNRLNIAGYSNLHWCDLSGSRFAQLFSLFVITLCLCIGSGCGGGTRGTGGTENLKISGTLVDSSSGQPIAGATVTILETGEISVTDINGQFSFNSAPYGEDIVFSIISASISATTSLGTFTQEVESISLLMRLNTQDSSAEIVDVVIDSTRDTDDDRAPDKVTPQAIEPTATSNGLPPVATDSTPAPQLPTVSPTANSSETPDTNLSPPPSTPSPTSTSLPPLNPGSSPQLLSFTSPRLESTSIDILISADQSTTAMIKISGSNEVKTNSRLGTSHQFSFTGLTPETSYSFMITLTNEVGVESQVYQKSVTTPVRPQLMFDSAGQGGVNSATVYMAGGLDMGSGTAALRLNGSGQLELFSRHLIYTSKGGTLTAVLYTTFTDLRSAFGDTVLLNSPQGGFVEIWYENGSGADATYANPQGYSDGIMVASGKVSGGFGSIGSDLEFGSVNLNLQINSANNNYFYSLIPTSGSISFIIGKSTTSLSVRSFSTSPGGIVSAISNLDAVEDFPDGGISFR
jgi:CarboxypepD_reg-like domain